MEKSCSDSKEERGAKRSLSTYMQVNLLIKGGGGRRKYIKCPAYNLITYLAPFAHVT